MPARKSRTRPDRPQNFRPPVPRLVSPKRRALLARAHQHAQEILLAAVTDSGPNEAMNDALSDLMQRSPYWEQSFAEQLGSSTVGLTNSCFDAGLALGVAFGLRLRGAA